MLNSPETPPVRLTSLKPYVMKTVLGFFVMLGMQAMCLGDGLPVTFHAQLIRGTDTEKPAQSTWKPVGPKLSKQLSPKFRWTNYWEVSRRATSVVPGKITRLRLAPDREIELELREADYEVRIFNGGKLSRRSRQKLESKMSIMGGGLEEKESWFIVVRQDPPTVE